MPRHLLPATAKTIKMTIGMQHSNIIPVMPQPPWPPGSPVSGKP
jgi:hypothetical protein